jgi:RNA polymerase sigma-70 factor (ECF subfamily)
MADPEWLTTAFERDRPRLRAVAYRVLGSMTDADDAVQEAWLRLSRAGADDVENLSAWLTTIVARVSLNMLRARRSRRENPLDTYVPDPIVGSVGTTGPEDEAVLADSIGLALQVVLDTLSPAERIAFVLHDMFDVPFDDIAPMVERTPAAARQLASRARRRVQGADRGTAGAGLRRQRQIVDAFFAASRAGRFNDLVALLSPDVVLRSDGGDRLPEASVILTGPDGVIAHARRFHQSGATLVPAVVNDAAGVLVWLDGRLGAVMSFTFDDERVAGIEILADPGRLERLAARLPNRPHK